MAPSAHKRSSGTADRSTASATLVLRRRAAISHLAENAAPLTSRQLGDRFGASPDDLKTVRKVAEEAGLTVVAEHSSSRRVRVEGPADMIRAWIAETPEPLIGIVTAILGGQAPQAFPRSIVATPRAVIASYTPLQLAEIYGMPQADGAGQRVAIIELGGGFGQADLDTYFKGLGLATPNITAVGVDGGENEPGRDPSGADVEVLLDIEVAGAIAPNADFLVYFAPNTDAGFLDAVSTAAHASPTPAAMSISWGQSEDRWSEQARSAMDEAFADAVAMGVTVIAAAGDNGSTDSDPSGSRTHTDFPASSPHVLGCGGTSLRATDGQETSETVWNDGGRGGATGGGISDIFPLPGWQSEAGVPEREGGGVGRGVPDVAAVADPQTGYQVLADGKRMVVGGTSAVAPLWAGLVARIVQLSGVRAGLAQTALYAGVTPGTAAPHLRDITEGSNGAYDAGPGWDPCTGLGVPDADTSHAFSPTGANAGTGRAFEYAQLSLERDPGQRGGDGDWLVTAYWRQGDSRTPVASSEHGPLNAIVLLNRYGADGWELVGPPEVQPYPGAFAAAGRDDSNGQGPMEPGDWVAKRFWMRRETQRSELSALGIGKV